MSTELIHRENNKGGCDTNIATYLQPVYNIGLGDQPLHMTMKQVSFN